MRKQGHSGLELELCVGGKLQKCLARLDIGLAGRNTISKIASGDSCCCQPTTSRTRNTELVFNITLIC